MYTYIYKYMVSYYIPYKISPVASLGQWGAPSLAFCGSWAPSRWSKGYRKRAHLSGSYTMSIWSSGAGIWVGDFFGCSHRENLDPPQGNLLEIVDVLMVPNPFGGEGHSLGAIMHGESVKPCAAWAAKKDWALAAGKGSAQRKLIRPPSLVLVQWRTS